MIYFAALREAFLVFLASKSFETSDNSDDWFSEFPSEAFFSSIWAFFFSTWLFLEIFDDLTLTFFPKVLDFLIILLLMTYLGEVSVSFLSLTAHLLIDLELAIGELFWTTFLVIWAATFGFSGLF